jgi:hypothetical protein
MADAPTPASELPTLPIYGTTPLYAPATGGHLAVNPAVDLTVTAAHADTALYVWRSGDAMAVGKYGEKGPVVRGVRWRADGVFFLLFSFFWLLPAATVFCLFFWLTRGRRRVSCCGVERRGGQGAWAGGEQGGAAYPGL